MSEHEIYEEHYDFDDQALLDFIREETAGNSAIEDLTDDEVTYIIDLWYDYLEQFDDNGEEIIEIDSDDLYSYITNTLKREEAGIEISFENLIALLDAEQGYIESITGETDLFDIED